MVNISSIAARGGGVVGPHYAASKAGQLGMTRYAARELAPYGITVNAIAPAFIEDAGIFTSWGDAQKQALNKKSTLPAWDGCMTWCGPLNICLTPVLLPVLPWTSTAALL